MGTWFASVSAIILGYTEGMEEPVVEPVDIVQTCTDVLRTNDRGVYTAPADGLYPHQWLWDSCFTAIGLRHVDIERAKTEILSLLEAQWHNGMVPHMILRSPAYVRDANIWRSWLNPNSPDGMRTSGITQPPLLAEAIVQIGQKMKLPERRSWYKQTYPALLAYHRWLYAERDPHNEGLVLQIHPWEVGLDNTPPWISELHTKQKATWIGAIEWLHAGWFPSLFRRDTRFVPGSQRANIIDMLALFSSQRRLRRKNYDIKRILDHALFAIEDVTFNAIFARANQQLASIAKAIREDIPVDLAEHMSKTEQALEQLWDPYSSQYYSREFISHRLIKEPSIAALTPLYSGAISQERAKHLVEMLKDDGSFSTPFPVPSVPHNSAWFDADRYWQGPTWINTNWMIIDGLRRYGFDAEADILSKNTVTMVAHAGCYEYFNPLDGSGIGAPNFSWTAALTLDLIKQNH